MNKLAIIPILLLALGGGLMVYGVAIYSINYTVTVHDTTTYSANIILVTPAQVSVSMNEGETATSTITLRNEGNAAGTVTLSTSGQLPAHFAGGDLTTTITIPAGDTVSLALYIPAPSEVAADTQYTVTVSVS